MGGVRSLAKWKRVRRAAIERDGYRCRACGKAAGSFEVDHIVPLSAGGEPYALEGFKLYANPVTCTRRPSSGRYPACAGCCMGAPGG